MTYADKLRDPRWQKRRLEILERDKWECRRCGAKDQTLHVHHLKYVRGRDPWDYDDGDYTTLCDECHETVHRHQKEETAWQKMTPDKRWNILIAMMKEGMRS